MGSYESLGQGGNTCSYWDGLDPTSQRKPLGGVVTQTCGPSYVQALNEPFMDMRVIQFQARAETGLVNYTDAMKHGVMGK